MVTGIIIVLSNLTLWFFCTLKEFLFIYSPCPLSLSFGSTIMWFLSRQPLCFFFNTHRKKSMQAPEAAAPPTDLSQDRVEELLRQCALHTTKTIGSVQRPQKSTDPLVDTTAWNVAKAILCEPAQDGQLLRQRYTTQIPTNSRGDRCSQDDATRMRWEWNARKLIHDRVWNWMQFDAHSETGKDARLGPGRMTIDVFHRCNSICQPEHVNLLHNNASLSLTACPASGMVHLCRANSQTCHSLDESKDSTLVCLSSGHVCMQAGVGVSHPSQSIDFARGERHLVFQLWKKNQRLDISDPENARRARAVQRQLDAGCPQISHWDPVMGILTLDVHDATPCTTNGPTFDTTFMWGVSPASKHAPKQLPTTEKDTHPSSSSSMWGVSQVGGMMKESHCQRKATRKRQTRTSELRKRLRATRQHVQDRFSGMGGFTKPKIDATPVGKSRAVPSARGGTGKRKRGVAVKTTQDAGTDKPAIQAPTRGLRFEIMFQQERQVVERILYDILWDVVARQHSNAYFAELAQTTAQNAIRDALLDDRRQMTVKSSQRESRLQQGAGASWASVTVDATGPPRINQLLQCLASQRNTQATPVTNTSTPTSPVKGDACPLHILSLDRVRQIGLAAVKDHLVPLVSFDKERHEHLVCATLYLWRYIMHEPLSVPSTTSPQDNDGGDGEDEKERIERPSFSTFRDCLRKRRNSGSGSATLPQFALGVLYTAASSGIDIGALPAWPRDGWLADVLPSVKTLQFYGSQSKLGARIALKSDDCGDRLTASLREGFSPLIFASNAEKRRRRREALQSFSDTNTRQRNGVPKGHVGLYQMKDVTTGKRAVSLIVRTYAGSIPTPQEASVALDRFYWRSVPGPHRHYDPYYRDRKEPIEGPLLDGTTSRRKVIVTRTKRSSLLHSSSSSSSTLNGKTRRQRHNNNEQGEEETNIMFSCLFVTQRKDRIHICRMNNPTIKHTTPPGLTPTLVRRHGWHLDTVVGPFAKEHLARAFSIAWGQARCTSLAERREFGRRLAHRIAGDRLGIWIQDGAMPLDPSSKQRGLAAQSRAKRARMTTTPTTLPPPTIRSTASYSIGGRGLVDHSGMGQRSPSPHRRSYDSPTRLGPALPNAFASLWQSPQVQHQHPQSLTT